MPTPNTCRTGIITIATRGGRVVKFKGRHGKNCPKRPKPTTAHLAPYKEQFSKSAKTCWKKAEGSASEARRCIGTYQRVFSKVVKTCKASRKTGRAAKGCIDTAMRQVSF